jgi:phage shock protein A
MGDNSNAAAFDRMKNKVQHSEATAQASSEMATDMAADNVDEKFAALEKQDEVERLLAELKSKMKAG